MARTPLPPQLDRGLRSSYIPPQQWGAQMPDAGLYIVTLNNIEPISVNANDPRRAECIEVARGHCKLGKARSLAGRARSYEKVFGANNVNFRGIAHTAEIAAAERCALAQLKQWRVRGKSGRRNEWLLGIDDVEVERIALSALAASGIAFARLLR